MFRRKLKFIYQRLTRGFSDRVTWNLGDEIAKFTLPRIKRYRELVVSPDCVAGHPGNITHEQWIEILDKIIYSLDCMVRQFEMEDFDIDQDKWTEGMALLGNWLNDLWW